MNAELELLKQLRATPQLMALIGERDTDDLSVQQRLRADYEADLVRAALSLAQARHRAVGTLPRAEQLWLTTTGVEQATHPIVAEHKAGRFARGAEVLDLCSGIGCDAGALSRRGPLTVVDRDESMLQRCLWNLDVWDCPQPETQLADVGGLSLSGMLIHVDPDRRSGRNRPSKRLEQYSPDLSWMQRVTQTAAGGAIKIGPASNFIQKFPDCEIELISLHGECREATVWFGELSVSEQFRATVLPAGETICGDPLSAWANVAENPNRYVYDPDPAVVRSGLIDLVCDRHHLDRLDGEEEYLTSDVLVESSFVTPFEVEAVLSNNPKQLRQYLRSSPGSYYEIKCRHVPVDAAAVSKKLPTGGDTPKVILFVRVQGRTKAIVARRLAAAV